MSSSCVFCKQKPKSSFFGLSPYWYCANCNVAWIKKVPKVEYGDTYYKGKSSLMQKLFIPVADFFYGVRRAYAGDKKKSVWVDVGAGEGGFLKTVDAKKRIGVEVSDSGRKMMEDTGLLTLTDKTFLKSKGIGADVISFWHMLEHVENPWDYLKAAKNNLKKGGQIVIGVPNLDSYEFNFSRGYWFHLQPQFHLWHFSTNSLRLLLEQSGFKIKKIDTWSVEHHLTGVLQSFINKYSKSKENVLHKIVKRGTGKSPVILKDIVWAVFWMSIGSPIILGFWIAGSIMKKSGTIVVTATPKNTKP